MISQETRNCNAFLSNIFWGQANKWEVTALHWGWCTGRASSCFCRTELQTLGSDADSQGTSRTAFYPNGLFVFHPDRIYRAVSFAQAAANTAVLNAEMRGLSYFDVIERLSKQFRDQRRSSRGHSPVCLPPLHLVYDFGYFYLGRFCERRYLFRRRKVEDRRPCIWHSDG